MKENVSVYSFRDRFLQSDTYKNNFSYEGLTALYEYLEEYEQSTGTEIDFDMVAICCEYSEYKSAWEAMQEYQPEDMPTVDIVDENNEGKDLVEIQEESEKLALEWLEERTQVIPFEKGIIIQQF